MKYCRYQSADGPRFGVVENVGGKPHVTHVVTSPHGLNTQQATRIDPIPLDTVEILPPIAPSKIICVGRNYREHVKELGNEVPASLLIFSKPPSAVIAPGANIVRPRISQRVDHEGELAVIIGKTCRKVRDDEDVRPYIFGYTCANDVTARDLQKPDGQWTRAKGFDTFCPIGPIVSDEVDPWKGVKLETRVNGEVRQQGTTTDFIFPLDEVIRYISRVMTLLPGDLILTGTPAGVGPLQAGDVVDVSIDGVGILSNPVVDETD